MAIAIIVVIIKWCYMSFHMSLSIDVHLGIGFDVCEMECLKIVSLFFSVDPAPNGETEIFQSYKNE